MKQRDSQFREFLGTRVVYSVGSRGSARVPKVLYQTVAQLAGRLFFFDTPPPTPRSVPPPGNTVITAFIPSRAPRLASVGRLSNNNPKHKMRTFAALLLVLCASCNAFQLAGAPKLAMKPLRATPLFMQAEPEPPAAASAPESESTKEEVEQASARMASIDNRIVYALFACAVAYACVSGDPEASHGFRMP